MRNVLVVVDMQNDFVNQALGTEEAVQIVPAVIEEILKEKYDTVIATLDTHSEDYMSTLEGKYLPVSHCIKGTEGWKIHPEIQKALDTRDTIYIEKPTFGSLQLLGVIEQYRPEEITFTGLCTDICVVSNALLAKAALYESEVNVIEKATAGVTPESKEAALKTMQSCQIHIL